MYLDPLLKLGNLVDLDVGYWQGLRELTPEDLGLIEIPDTFKLGKKFLVPKEEINKFVTFRQRIRRNYIRNSFAFPFGSCRFMPNTTFYSFKTKMEILNRKYDALAEEFRQNYWKHKLAMRKSFLDAAEKAYQVTRTTKNKEEFIEDFLERIETFYPKIEEIKDCFYAQYHVFKIGYPDMLKIVIPTGQETTVENLQAFFKKDLDEKMDKFIKNLVKEHRSSITKAFIRITKYLETDKSVVYTALRHVAKSIEAFRNRDFYGDERVLTQTNRVKAFVSKIQPIEFYNSVELRDELKVRLGDVIKIASHVKSLELATQEFKNKLLGKAET